MANLQNKKEWENKICYNNKGDEFKIIEYKGTHEVILEFTKTGYRGVFSLSNIKTGSVSDLLAPSVYGVGYFGVGVYKSKISSVSTIFYKRWQTILQRCYDTNSKMYIAYGNNGVIICDEWKNFQNFAKWWYENWNENTMDSTWEIDKDLINKNSKVYSPENCLIIPSEINVVLTKRLAKRGLYPIGVSMKGSSYIAQINKDGQKIHLGSFKSPENAFNAYKKAKESHLKELAEVFKDSISSKAYLALLKYEVSIDD